MSGGSASPFCGVASDGWNQIGVESGCAGLFRGRPWVGTLGPERTRMLRSRFNSWLRLSAQWIQADPLIPDQAVALISHLP